MKVLATYGIKGGVGKTSTAVNMAYLAARDGARVLLWDLDPQASATFLLRVKPRIKGGGRRLILGQTEIDARIKATDYDRFDLLPGDLSYRHMDLVLDEHKRPTRRLRRLLAPLRDDFDVVILDCPPGITLLAESIFEAADTLLVPLIPATLSMRTLDQLESFLADVDRRPDVLAFFSMVDGRKRLHREVLESAEPGRRWTRVLECAIPAATEIELMGVKRAAVGDFAPRSRAALAYDALWHEIRTHVPVPHRALREHTGMVLVRDGWDAIERCYEEGWTDGLPVVPPTEELVDRYLAALGWSGEEILLTEPVRSIEVPSIKVVVNAILAGCLPLHLPVVAAALRAMSHPDFALHIPASSTGGAAPVLVVNGPVRNEIDINCGGNLFGSGRRANAVIGRAVRLVLMNCLGAVPGILDMATQGWFGKYTACFGEREEASPWLPLHVRRGFAANVSTVTVLATESAHNVHTRSGVSADGWLYTAGDVLRCLGSHSDGQGFLVIGPEHAAILGAAGLSVADIQQHLFEASRRSLAELKRAGRLEDDVAPGDESRSRPRGRVPEDIIVLVGGGDAGCSSAWFPTWSRGRGSVAVTAPVDPGAGPVVSSVPGPADAPGLGDGS